MAGNKSINIVEKKLKALREKREEVLKLDPEDALNRIIDYKESLPLVHSFPEQSLYMLMHEAGHEDFLPILSMATKKQWEYIIDLEIWNRDEIDITNISYWLGVLNMADPARLASWLLEEQDDLLSYFLRNKIDVVIREHDEDPSIIGSDFITFDDVIYFRVLEDRPGSPVFMDTKSLVGDILARIAEKSYPMYQTIIFISAGVINAEHVENLYRQRNSRLEGKGLLPLYEAVEIYAPVDVEEIKKRKRQKIESTKDNRFVDKEGNLDSGALLNIFATDNYLTIPDSFSQEFVALCNRIIVADKKGVKTRDDLEAVGVRVSGILKAGAQILGDFSSDIENISLITDIFNKYSLIDVFMVGNTRIREIREKCLKWQRESWLSKNNLELTFLGEKWLGVVGGLLVWPCKYFDNFETGTQIYRPFNSREDLNYTDSIIESIIAIDDLFALIDVKEIKSRETTLTWENFLLTLWARDWLHLDEQKFEPIKLDDFQKFFNWLWVDEDGLKITGKDKKQDFLNWIVRVTDIEAKLLVARLGKVFDSVFENIDDEYGHVDGKDLNTNLINYFIVEK